MGWHQTKSTQNRDGESLNYIISCTCSHYSYPSTPRFIKNLIGLVRNSVFTVYNLLWHNNRNEATVVIKIKKNAIKK